MFMTTHMAAMPASQIGSDCLHHLKSSRSCWENPKICQTGLAVAPDCIPKHQPIRSAYGTSCEPISERAAAARGKRHKGRRGGRPAMPPWRRSRRIMEEGLLWGHSWRFRRCSVLEEASLCAPSGKAHDGAKMLLKAVWPMCKSRAELRKWV